MQLEKLLKQLKTIEPDIRYTLRSREEILARQPKRGRWLAWKEVVYGIIQSGSAIALTGVIILLMGGAFSLRGIIAREGGFLDRQSLQAEAQAIDIQIQLADVSYDNFSSSGNEVMKATPVKSKIVAPSTLPASTSTPAQSAAPTSTPDMSVDQALDLLSNP